jgi:hypothetical protein
MPTDSGQSKVASRATRGLLGLSMLVLFFALSPTRQMAWAGQTTHVIIVVIDGPRDSECFEDPQHLYVPRIWNTLRPLGYVSHSFYNTGVTTTVPGHSTVASGTWQSMPDDGTVRPDRPLIWEYLRDQTGVPDRSIALVTYKTKLRALSYSTAAGYGPPDSSYVIGPTWDDGISLQRLLTHLATYQTTLSMISFAGPDVMAHQEDWNGYVGAIARADSLTAFLWNWLQSHSVYARHTALFVTADHGRHTTDWINHGDACAGCRHLPFLALGPDFLSGVEASAPPADQRDIAVTAAGLLGIAMPYAQGRFMSELLRDQSDVPPWTLDVDPSALRVCPSPARDEISVRLGAPAGGARWLATLYDVQGRRLTVQEIPGSRLAGGAVLSRPPGLPEDAVTYLELRPVQGSDSRRWTRPVIWLR